MKWQNVLQILKAVNPMWNLPKNALENVAKYASSVSQVVTQTEPSKMEKCTYIFVNMFSMF